MEQLYGTDFKPLSCAAEKMERSGTSGTTDRPQNPTFAILGLSHIGSRCAGVPEWSSSLSVSCFGQSHSSLVDSADNDQKMEPTSPRPTRMLSDDDIVRKLSAKANRRCRLSSNVDRRPTKPPPPPATSLSSLQVPSVSYGRTNQRPSHVNLKRNSLSSESLIISPLRGSTTACSNSPDWQSVGRETGSRSRTNTVDESSRRDVFVLPPTTTSQNDILRGTSTTTGRHLDVFLPSLVARQTAESDE